MEKRWVKVRLLDDNVPVYGSEKADSPVLMHLNGKPVVEVSCSAIEARLRVVLPHEKEGFIPATTRRLSLIVWAVPRQSTVLVYTEPALWAPVVAALSSGDRIELLGEKITSNDSDWFPVRVGRKQGYLSGRATVVYKGNQVRIPGNGRYTEKDGALLPIPRTKKQAAAGQMIAGALMLLVGILITVGTFAASSAHGGIFVFTWGFIVFGAVEFFRGLAGFISAFVNGY